MRELQMINTALSPDQMKRAAEFLLSLKTLSFMERVEAMDQVGLDAGTMQLLLDLLSDEGLVSGQSIDTGRDPSAQ